MEEEKSLSLEDYTIKVGEGGRLVISKDGKEIWYLWPDTSLSCCADPAEYLHCYSEGPLEYRPSLEVTPVLNGSLYIKQVKA